MEKEKEKNKPSSKKDSSKRNEDSKQLSKKEAAAISKAQAKELKKKKQEAKALKKEKKKNAKQKKNAKGEIIDDDDVDDEEFEKLVAEILARDVEHNAVTVEKLTDDPDYRASFSLCAAGSNPQDGFVIFGGEYFDGATSKCFDHTLRFRLLQPTTREWKKISSQNSPPPRCAHAACTTPTHVYIFGGEFSTAWRFHHYNDLWRLDLKTNQWQNMPSIGGPSPRSGCRMVSWKNFLVVFGGFYEASRGVRWFDDLYFYDLKTEKWSKPKFASSVVQHPSARSGFQFCCHPTKPMIYLYGGYSKVAASSSAQRGRALDDMWVLHLSLPSQKQSVPEVKWEFISKRGQTPPKRSGASSCVHKTRILLFGGVSDTVTENDVIGDFSNSLYAFDMDRHRRHHLSFHLCPLLLTLPTSAISIYLR